MRCDYSEHVKLALGFVGKNWCLDTQNYGPILE